MLPHDYVLPGRIYCNLPCPQVADSVNFKSELGGKLPYNGIKGMLACLGSYRIVPTPGILPVSSWKLVITVVKVWGPAEAAGIRKLDVIVSIGGKSVCCDLSHVNPM